MSDYNGWTNYETWVVKLWMDNEQSSCEYWKEQAQEAYSNTGDKAPNPYMSHMENAKRVLADQLKDEHDDQSEHPVFEAANGSVYADLLNAALSEVSWLEIAESLLDANVETEVQS